MFSPDQNHPTHHLRFSTVDRLPLATFLLFKRFLWLYGRRYHLSTTKLLRVGSRQAIFFQISLAITRQFMDVNPGDEAVAGTPPAGKDRDQLLHYATLRLYYSQLITT